MVYATRTSLYLFLCLSVCLSVCLSDWLAGCLFVCLSLYRHFFLLVPRLWQSLGYLIVYVTGRPNIQKQYLMSWLGLHEFPIGIMSLSDSLSADSQGIKKAYLIKLMKEVEYLSVCLSVCLSVSLYFYIYCGKFVDCSQSHSPGFMYMQLVSMVTSTIRCAPMGPVFGTYLVLCLWLPVSE